jgi:AcrR family transcriptional regulator
LRSALDAFRKDGFAATSIDDLTAATGMNRPSLYGAFGDKRDLYIKSYDRYRSDARAAMADVLAHAMPLRKRLDAVFMTALNIYLAGSTGPSGCFTVMSAASDAVFDADIRAMVTESLRSLDDMFVSVMRNAQDAGELPAEADPLALAQICSATLHTVAIRARSGVAERDLKRLIRGVIEVVCGPAARRSRPMKTASR